jgi:general secretion pathway protein D
VLKPTARILPGLIVVALGLPVLFSPVELGAQVNAPGSGQPSQPQSPDAARHQSNELLQRARLAMAENDLGAAAQLLSQAEALGVDYGPLYLGDTPKKARRDLERMAQANGGPARPGQMFSPLAAGKASAPARDPFAGRNVDPAAAVLPDAKSIAKSHILKARRELDQGNLPGAVYWYNQAVQQPATFGPAEDSPERLAADIRSRGGQVPAPAPARPATTIAVTPLPPVDPSVQPMAPPPSASHPNRAQCDRLLLEARRALALGDARTASAKLNQAKTLGVPYGPGEDSPARVEAAVGAYNDLISQRASRGTTEAYRHQYARILLDQAQALLRWRDFDEAERLATTAAQQYANFSPSEVNPQMLLERVAAERRQAMSPGGNSAPMDRNPNAGPSLAAKQRATHLIREARNALRAGDLRAAEDLARQAERMQIPDSYYAVGEDRPSMVLADIQQAQRNGPSGVIQASGQYVNQAGGPGGYDRRASQALYDRNQDSTHNMLAGAQEPTPAPPGSMGPAGQPETSMAMQWFQQGEAALRAHQSEAALQHFRQAATRSNELDPVTQQRLQDFLQMLSAPTRGHAQAPTPPSMLDEAAARQQVLARQVTADLAHMETNAEKMRETDPKGALALLEQAREKAAGAGLEPAARDQLLRRVDRKIADMKQYIEQNKSRISLDERNEQVRQQINMEREQTLNIQDKLAQMVEEYNQLMREQRFAEAEVVAKRAAQLDPKNPLTQQLVLNAKFIRTYSNAMQVKADKEDGTIAALAAVDQSAIPFDDMNPYRFSDVKEWGELTRRRSKLAEKSGRKRSERDLEIERKLRTPVMLQFDNAPLSQVLEYLAKLAEVNLHLDPRGLSEEGITSDTPVTINLSQEISLQSALNLILQPLHLGYVVKDEVLKITSEQMRNGEVYTQTYNVADLVIPIPNFIPSSDMGLAGAYRNGLNSAYNTSAGMMGMGGSPMAVVASKEGQGGRASINPSVLAQMTGGMGGGMGGSSSMPMGFGGPGGLSGASGADFDSLIELITSTIQPTTWDEVGGPGSIAPFETNLSLVISQTQDVHEEVADLLEQLRRLQDLQVTIEVRFITLNDNFFEKIGVDFDFDINDKIDRPYQIFGRPIDGQYTDTGEIARNTSDYDSDESVSVGITGPTTGFGPALFSADLDIPFRQGSYGLASPQFGGYDPTAGAQLGFAILSDIEAYFFIEAAQGDKRSNVLQAPKVTLFNGQQAFVSDTSQSPFVISVIPVVGDFAAAQQPVIVVLSEGTFLTVQAVVSSDRRFVRLTMIPFFSKITEVNTFTFEGEATTTEESSASGWVNASDSDKRNEDSQKKTSSRRGTTVQLPTFSFVTVTTTVSVPDGGTVLLGGIKRLSEGRNEFGVPMLNKIPYVNRLFKNVGIGRETQSLMMMVTPRIIIQEEEEMKLGVMP